MESGVRGGAMPPADLLGTNGRAYANVVVREKLRTAAARPRRRASSELLRMVLQVSSRNLRCSVIEFRTVAPKLRISEGGPAIIARARPRDNSVASLSATLFDRAVFGHQGG